MNTEQTSKNVFTYIKTHYGEIILAKIRKLEKTMIKYSSYTNYLRFSLRCHHSKILPKELQLKSRIKTERRKIILLSAIKKDLFMSSGRGRDYFFDYLKNFCWYIVWPNTFTFFLRILLKRVLGYGCFKWSLWCIFVGRDVVLKLFSTIFGICNGFSVYSEYCTFYFFLNRQYHECLAR